MVLVAPLLLRQHPGAWVASLVMESASWHLGSHISGKGHDVPVRGSSVRVEHCSADFRAPGQGVLARLLSHFDIIVLLYLIIWLVPAPSLLSQVLPFVMRLLLPCVCSSYSLFQTPMSCCPSLLCGLIGCESPGFG